jgi:hypothetical protein
MTGAPTVQVLLDDGTGTYPIDVSSRVKLPAGVSVSSYGRTDEFSEAQSAQLQLTLDNSDGGLSVGAGFDTLPFDSGPFGGGVLLSKGQGIRLKLTKGATTRNRFTGKVAGSSMAWPGGQGGFSELAVTAMDPLTDLAGYPMRSMLEEEILPRGPSAYYTLGEAAGSRSAGDTSGNQAPTLTQAGTGAPVVFGTGTGPVDGLTAATFGGGRYLTTGDSIPATLAYGLTVTFATTTTPASFSRIASSAGWVLDLSSSGQIAASGPGFAFTGGGPSVVDGHTYTAQVVSDGVTASVLLDGVVIDTEAVSGVESGPVMTVGGFLGVGLLGEPFTGTVSHVAAFPALSVVDAQAIAEAAATGFAGETTADRFARILGYTGLTGSTTAGMSGQTMSAQSTSGQSALEALQAVAAAEGGVLYADGSGTIVLQGRGYRAMNTTPDLTLSADELGSDTSITDDDQQQVKQVTVTRTDGATQVVGAGLPSTSLDLAVDNDGDALRAAQWEVAKHADPGPRIGEATLDLMTSTYAEQILQRDLGDRLAFTGMPSQLWAGAGDVVIDGWSETVTDQAWDLTANVLPWSLFQAGIYDDPTYGIYDDPLAVYGP